MSIPHYNVVIATPGYQMENAYVTSLINTIKYFEENDITWAYTSRTCSDVALAREWTIMAKSADLIGGIFDKPLSGAATYDKIFLIDSDIFWETEQFIKLYESDLDVISGAYLQSNGIDTVVYDNKQHLMNYEEFLNKMDIFEAGGIGLGFTCIKSGVFEKIQRPWFEHKNTVVPIGSNEFGVELMSEDISFIQKVREAGFKLYVDPSVRVGHVKQIHMTW